MVVLDFSVYEGMEKKAAEYLSKSKRTGDDSPLQILLSNSDLRSNHTIEKQVE